MAGDNPPKQRREQTDRIAAISHRIAEIGQQISAPIRNLENKFVALIDEMQTNNEAAETREKEYQERSLREVKRSARWTIGFSFSNLILSAAVFWILWNQLHAMRIDHRAWIRIEHAIEPIVYGQPLQAKFNVINTGKTPAKQVNMVYLVEKVATGSSPNFTSAPGMKSFSGLLIPNGSYPVTVARYSESGHLDPLVLTKTDVDEIMSGKAYVAIIAKITYLDIYDIPHWINFCYWKSYSLGDYNSRECVKYNDVDNNN